MRDKLPVMLSHDVARLLRKIRAIAIGKYTELLDVFLFQSGKQTRLRLLPHLLTAGPIPLAPPRNEAADNDLPGSERTFLHFESDAIGLVVDDIDHLHRKRRNRRFAVGLRSCPGTAWDLPAPSQAGSQRPPVRPDGCIARGKPGDFCPD